MWTAVIAVKVQCDELAFLISGDQSIHVVHHKKLSDWTEGS